MCPNKTITPLEVKVQELGDKILISFSPIAERKKNDVVLYFYCRREKQNESKIIGTEAFRKTKTINTKTSGDSN